ncbi:MAG UNVERIFIED_CONTAM: hypothetical protein LVR18_27950 [Planctomycetaceae bacterium]|jgi:hypothetical protein
MLRPASVTLFTVPPAASTPKLEAVLIVADSAGRDLLVERRGGVLDFKAPTDGRYVIKVHELTYKGGADYFYRLTLQNAAADAPLPIFPSTQTVSSFSWPPAGLPDTAPLAETEPNNFPAQAQQLTLPCDISGAFAAAADVDIFEFDARKGDTWWIEIASERLGRPTDPTAVLQQLAPAGTPEATVDLVELADIPSPMKPSSNGYAYDGPPYDGGSADFIGQVQIRETGRHRLLLSDLFGGTRTDPRNVYRLIIRRAAPDFASMRGACTWNFATATATPFPSHWLSAVAPRSLSKLSPFAAMASMAPYSWPWKVCRTA